MLEGVKEEDTPQLFVKIDTDANNVYIVAKQS
jgi:hypothetical protein